MSDIIPEKRANKDKFEYVIVAFAAAIVIYMMVSIFYLYVAVGEAGTLFGKIYSISKSMRPA